MTSGGALLRGAGAVVLSVDERRRRVCVFSAGTGRLTQFNLEVVLTANADQSVWYWDGTYWFGN